MKNIFIPYLITDKVKVKELKKEIEACGRRVWLYPEAISPGDDIIEEEKDAIQDSDAVFVVMSANSLNSPRWRRRSLLPRSGKRKTRPESFIY